MKTTEFAFSRFGTFKRYEFVEVPYVGYVDSHAPFSYFLRIYHEDGYVSMCNVKDFNDAISKIEKDYMKGRYAMGGFVQDAKKEKEDVIVDAQTELTMEEIPPGITFNGNVESVYINYTQNNFLESDEERDEK